MSLDLFAMDMDVSALQHALSLRVARNRSDTTRDLCAALAAAMGGLPELGLRMNPESAAHLGHLLVDLREALGRSDKEFPSEGATDWLHHVAANLAELLDVAEEASPLDSRRRGPTIRAALADWYRRTSAVYDSALPPTVNLLRLPTVTADGARRPLLVVVSGPSAAGKDCILAQLLPRLHALGLSGRSVHKYSTRPLRSSERSDPSETSFPRVDYQHHLKARDFERRVENGTLMLDYEKYDNRYALEAVSLRPRQESDILICIYSAFANIPYALNKLANFGSVVVPVLVMARDTTMERRMLQRSLARGDVGRRLTEMKADYDYLLRHAGHVRDLYPVVVWNDDPSTLSDAVETVLNVTVAATRRVQQGTVSI
jgi:ribose 1,5-bisphosphokinase PhnN